MTAVLPLLKLKVFPLLTVFPLVKVALVTLALATVTAATATEQTQTAIKQPSPKTDSTSATKEASITKKELAKMTKQDKTRPESVSAVSYDGENLRFTAISNGCTSPKHFEIEHVVATDQCEITIIRTQPDYCRKVPQAVEIVMPWSKPSGSETCTLVVVNPLLERGTLSEATAKSPAPKATTGSTQTRDPDK